MKNGYVCLWRKSLNSLVFGNEKCWKIWCWCLMRANFKENTFLLGRKKITIKPGQFVMGLKKSKEELDLAVSTIHYWLSFLEDEEMVELKKTNKYTIITIKNWKDYQGVELKKNSNQNANGTLKETNNNVNNDKEVTNVTEKYSELVYEDIDQPKKISKPVKVLEPFILANEIDKLLNSKRRDLNIVGFYFRESGLEIPSRAVFQKEVGRGLAEAKTLKDFTNIKIKEALKIAKQQYPVWTLETVGKVITKI